MKGCYIKPIVNSNYIILAATKKLIVLIINKCQRRGEGRCFYDFELHATVLNGSAISVFIYLANVPSATVTQQVVCTVEI